MESWDVKSSGRQRGFASRLRFSFLFLGNIIHNFKFLQDYGKKKKKEQVKRKKEKEGQCCSNVRQQRRPWPNPLYLENLNLLVVFFCIGAVTLFLWSEVQGLFCS